MENILFHPDRFGNEKLGFKFYPKTIGSQRTVIEASRESYFETRMMSGYWQHFCHCWVSCEGECEAYNLSHRSTDSTKGISRFLDFNPGVGKHFNKVTKREEEEDNDDEEEDEDHLNAGGSGKQGTCRMYEMRRKGLGQALRNWCVLEELDDRHLLNSVDEGELFGPMSSQGQAISLKESLDLFMESRVFQYSQNWI